MTEPSTRHTPLAVLERYRERSVAGAFPVAGAPAARVQIDPAGRRLLLLVVSEGPGPDVRGRRHLDYEPVDEAGVIWHRLTVDYAEGLPEVYAVLCSLLDRVQLRGEPFAQAVGAVLDGLSDIVAGRVGLTEERQLGLAGELLLLLAAASANPVPLLVRAWRGPDREEHDFAFAASDVEVKTTQAEDRTHWISTLTQLLPIGGRPLHLLSVQLTGAGNAPGWTLPDLVRAVRALPDVPGPELEARLRSAGYRDEQADLYPHRRRLRSAPGWFRVDEGFPALTPAGLASCMPRADRVVELRYRLTLTGLTPVAPPLHVDWKDRA